MGLSQGEIDNLLKSSNDFEPPQCDTLSKEEIDDLLSAVCSSELDEKNSNLYDSLFFMQKERERKILITLCNIAERFKNQLTEEEKKILFRY